LNEKFLISSAPRFRPPKLGEQSKTIFFQFFNTRLLETPRDFFGRRGGLKLGGGWVKNYFTLNS
jgi:hypothetical protein